VFRNLFIRAAVLCLLIGLLLAPPAAMARDEAWLTAPAFEVSADQLDEALDAFEARIDGLTPRAEGSDQARPNHIAVLLEEWGFSYDDQGRETLSHRRIYRVLTDSGTRSMNTLSAHWDPWHQDQPVLRARVIHPDGSEQHLDPTDAVVRGLPDPGQKIYSDARELVAPLPTLEVGSIVELSVEIPEHRPFCAAGRSHALGLDFDVPVAVTRFWVEQPRKADYAWMLHGEAELERRDIKLPEGRKRRVYTSRDRPAWDRLEGYLPSDQRLYPTIEYSNAPSWAAVADSYRVMVEQALSDPATATAVAPIVAEALGDDDPASLERVELIRRLAAAMRARVRYISLNLGEAAIVPRSPPETLKRAYGDCKDQATLLVAVLAAVGIDARVALVTTGPGPDQVHDMPGLDGFNHAIVVIPGPEDFWIDPAHHLASPGSLPAADQDRLALIIDPATQGLTRTPLSASADNKLFRTMRMELPFHGSVTTTETTWGTGPTDADMRGWGQHMQQHLLADMRTSAEAREPEEDGLLSIEHSDPEDLTTPFVMTEVRLDSHQGGIADSEAWVLLGEAVFFDYLPYQAWHTRPDGEPGRQGDLWYAPFGVELRYEVVPPDGYELVRQPEPVDQAMGLAHYTRSVEQVGDEVVVTFTLDWPQARLSPQELELTQAAFVAMGKESTEMVVFKHSAQLHLEDGDYPAAVSTFRRLIRDWPDEPLHKAHLAELLVQLGMVQAAKDWMAEAKTQIEGNESERAKLVLAYDAWVKTHDDIGTFSAGGYDRAAAIEAWRLAAEAEPDNTNSLFGLTHALRTDDLGEPLPADHLDRIEGLDLLREARERMEDNAEVDEALLQALTADQVHAEALALAEELPRTGQGAGTLLAEQCIVEGVQAATSSQEWRAMDSSSRAQAVGVAYLMLLRERRYQDAASLLRKLEATGRQAMVMRGIIDMLNAAKPWEEHQLDPTDPVDVVQQFLTLAMAPDTAPEDLAALFSDHTDIDELSTAADWFSAEAQQKMKGVAGELVPENAVADLIRAMATGEVIEEIDGDAKVRLDLRDPVGGRNQRVVFFMLRDGEHWKILAAEDMLLFNMGGEALVRLDRGEPEQALRWLEWALGERELDNPEDPWSSWSFVHLMQGLDAENAQGLQLAAAALYARSGKAPAAVALLEQALAGEQDEHTHIHTARALAAARHNAEDYEGEVEVLWDLHEAYPDIDEPFNALTAALPRLQAYAERAAMAEARLERLPDDPTARAVLAFSLTEMGQTDRARALFEALEDEGELSTQGQNQRAWMDVVEGKVDTTTLIFAQKALESSSYERAASLHTMACTLLEQGEHIPAFELWSHTKQLEGYDGTDLPDHWWYVAGRMAELLEEPQQALAFYRRMEFPEHPSPMRTWNMVERRLEALESAQ
jgi:tetratricopeptide (TPR) repeat protein